MIVQQVSRTFDAKCLQMSMPLDVFMQKCVSASVSLVSSDDEVVGTLEGLECLSLQAMYHINAGNLRRAWLCWRRALNLGQLMGLHHRAQNPMMNVDIVSSTREKLLWFQIVKADRYM